MSLNELGRGFWSEIRVEGKKIPPRSNHAYALLQDTLYVHGGQRPDIVLGDFWSLALADSPPRWTELEATGGPGPRSYHRMVPLPDGLLVLGGNDRKGISQNTVWLYRSQTWAQKAPMPLYLYSFVAEQVDGRVFVLTGLCSATIQYNTRILIYDLKEDSWESHPLPEGAVSPRVGACSCSSGSSIYLFGGQFDRKLSDLWEMDSITLELTQQIFSKIHPRRRSGASLCYSERGLLLFGGIHDITSELDDLHLYSLAEGQWDMLHYVDSKYESVMMVPETDQSQSLKPAKKICPARLYCKINLRPLDSRILVLPNKPPMPLGN
jgi:hypothetical protein